MNLDDLTRMRDDQHREHMRRMDEAHHAHMRRMMQCSANSANTNTLMIALFLSAVSISVSVSSIASMSRWQTHTTVDAVVTADAGTDGAR